MTIETSSILYNLIMIIGDLWVLYSLTRQEHKLGHITRLGLLIIIALLSAIALRGNVFGMLRLMCYALFLHGFIILTGLALLLRQASRRLAISAMLTAVILGIIAIYAFLIEPYWLEVSHVQLTKTKLTQPLKIVVVSDFQTDIWGEYQQESLKRVMQEKADLILFAGDYIHANQEQQELIKTKINLFLKEIRLSSPLGAYAIEGTTEIGNTDWPDIFQGLPVKVIKKTETLKLPSFCLTGLNHSDSSNIHLKIPECDRFHIVLGHVPNFALGDVRGDLLIAGHTHGGQFRLPFIGPMAKASKVPRKWAAGVTNIGADRTLVVSRGIGMERGLAPRFRFLSRPELVVIHLKPA
jgi:uncharacterized protein